MNYGVRLGSWETFSVYQQEPARFIYESNQGGRTVFGPTLEAVIAHW